MIKEHPQAKAKAGFITESPFSFKNPIFFSAPRDVTAKKVKLGKSKRQLFTKTNTLDQEGDSTPMFRQQPFAAPQTQMPPEVANFIMAQQSEHLQMAAAADTHAPVVSLFGRQPPTPSTL